MRTGRRRGATEEVWAASGFRAGSRQALTRRGRGYLQAQVLRRKKSMSSRRTRNAARL